MLKRCTILSHRVNDGNNQILLLTSTTGICNLDRDHVCPIMQSTSGMDFTCKYDQYITIVILMIASFVIVYMLVFENNISSL